MSSIKSNLTFFLSCLIVSSCSFEDRGDEQNIVYRWNGKNAEIERTYIVNEDSADFYGLSKDVANARFLLFTDWDTLIVHLQRFPNEISSFYHFQQQVPDTADLLLENFEKDNKWFFRDGKFIGCIYFATRAYLPRHVLLNNFNFKNHPRLPGLFQSLPFLERIQDSERVYKDEYLGIKVNGWILEAAYPCHQDIAFVFRMLRNQNNGNFLKLQAEFGTLPDTLSWGSEYLLKGRTNIGEPFQIMGFPEGLAGVIGCGDPVRTKFFLNKLKKLNVLDGFS